MEQKLTPIEVSKVFAMHYGLLAQRVIRSTGEITGVDDVAPIDSHGDVIRDIVKSGYWSYKILLTSLDKISDEDLIEISTFVINGRMSKEERIYIGEKTIEFHYRNMIDWDCDHPFDTARNRDFISTVRPWAGIAINNFLILKAYAVPLWFGVNHWSNGKTAIELNIAIEKP